jgi:hypothetical protein
MNAPLATLLALLLTAGQALAAGVPGAGCRAQEARVEQRCCPERAHPVAPGMLAADCCEVRTQPAGHATPGLPEVRLPAGPDALQVAALPPQRPTLARAPVQSLQAQAPAPGEGAPGRRLFLQTRRLLL